MRYPNLFNFTRALPRMVSKTCITLGGQRVLSGIVFAELESQESLQFMETVAWC